MVSLDVCTSEAMALIAMIVWSTTCLPSKTARSVSRVAQVASLALMAISVDVAAISFIAAAI